VDGACWLSLPSNASGVPRGGDQGRGGDEQSRYNLLLPACEKLVA